jgi:glycosyltransferase involved in cell wall biosynthesis
MRSGVIVVCHLSVQLPFAGIIWQLLHHLIGFQRLGFDVHYLEDTGGWVYDPVGETFISDPTRNLKVVATALAHHGFRGRVGFHEKNGKYLGISRAECIRLLRDADAVINLCGALDPVEEHANARCLLYLGTDPGQLQVELEQRDPETVRYVAAHKLFFTYAWNLGNTDCLLPTAGLQWKRTRPPILLDYWSQFADLRDSGVFTTIGTWENKGRDIEIVGEHYSWSKRDNFLKMAGVPDQSGQTIELATDLKSGPDYDQMKSAGFKIRSAIPLSLDIDEYRKYIALSRGEFTVAKDVVARTRSGWFSDRSACYLASGRPVVTQSTGFEQTLPTGAGLFQFDNAQEAAVAIHSINSDYSRHCRAAREIAVEYFDAAKLLKEIAEAVGL